MKEKELSIFNFNQPEEKIYPFYLKLFFMLMAILFLLIPLWEIDNVVFGTNEAYFYFENNTDDSLINILKSCQ